MLLGKGAENAAAILLRAQRTKNGGFKHGYHVARWGFLELSVRRLG